MQQSMNTVPPDLLDRGDAQRNNGDRRSRAQLVLKSKRNCNSLAVRLSCGRIPEQALANSKIHMAQGA
jgi:hypothetical protein